VIKIKKINFESDIPLYVQIKNYIREKIETGELKKGDKIPPEELLCEKYNVSKITVIRALRDLVNEGIIFRKQGKGSFVKEPDYKEDLNKLANFKNIDTWSHGKAEHKILEWHIIKPSKEIRNRMKLTKKGRALEIVRLRLFKGEPVAFERTYIPDDLIPSLEEKRELFEKKFVYDIFKTMPNISPESSQIFIKPILADEFYAKTFKITVGDPLLLWDRTTYSKDKKIIEFSIFCARGDKCKHHIEFP
jgi:DNA-binding GntR family transcriptional regulator